MTTADSLTTTITSIDDLIAVAEQAEQRKQDHAAQQAREDLDDRRQRFAESLPAGTWTLFGVDPMQAGDLHEKTIRTDIDVFAGDVSYTFTLYHDGQLKAKAFSGTTFAISATLPKSHGSSAQENLLALAHFLAQAAKSAQALRRHEHDRTIKTIRGELLYRLGATECRKLAAAIDEIPDITPDERAELRAAVAAKLDEARREQHAQRRRRQCIFDQAAQIIELAGTHAAEVKKYQAACKTWADAETDRLWQPHSLWRITYVPIGWHRFTHEIDEYQWSDLRETVVTLEHPTEIAATGIGTRVHCVGSSTGEIQTKWIGCFLHGEEVRFDAPVKDRPLPYHRSIRAGGYYVNIPCDLDAAPKDPPAPPPLFDDLVDQHLPERNIENIFGRYRTDYESGRWTEEEIAELTPEQYLAQL